MVFGIQILHTICKIVSQASPTNTNYKNMEQKLQNQIAIITGASSGIGSGIAKCIAASGATVIINHSSQSSKPSAEAILKEITDRKSVV